MMKKILEIIIIGLIITVTIISLQPSKPIDKNLILAEELMSDHPDSSLQVLERLNINKFKGENKALYALLMTQAQFKNYKPVNSDSLFNFAYEYYVKRKDPLRKAQVYFYKGRFYENFKSLKEAVGYYQKASIAAKQIKDYSFLALIYSRWGTLFFKQNLYNDAFALKKKSLEYSVLSRDTLKQIFGLIDIGKIYSANKEYDKAINYFNKALKFALSANNSDRVSDIYAMLGYVCKCMPNYESGIYYLNKSISMLSDSTLHCYRYLLKGDLLLLNNQCDSAKFYLNKGRNQTDLTLEASYCLLMSQLEKKTGHYKEALNLSNRYIDYSSKIIDTEREKAISELQKKYDYTVIKNENNELKISRQRVQIIALAISLIALVSIILSLYYFYRKRSVKRAMKLELDKMQRDLMNEKSNYYKEKTIEAQRNLIKEQELGRELSLKTEALKIHQEREKELKEHIFQMETVVKKIDAFNSMKPLQRIKSESQFTLTYQELCNLEEAMNLCHEQFAARLRATYPKLKDNDVHLCCLLKLKVPGKNIMGLLNLSELTLKKRKYRIKHEKMEMPVSVTSLDDFLCSF